MAEFNYKIMSELQEKADRMRGLHANIFPAPDEEQEVSVDPAAAAAAAGPLFYAVYCEATVLTGAEALTFHYVQAVKDPETDVVHTRSPSLITSTVHVTPITTAQEAFEYLRNLTPTAVAPLG